MVKYFSIYSFAAGVAFGVLGVGAYMLVNTGSLPITSPFIKTNPVRTIITAEEVATVRNDSGALSVQNQKAGDAVVIESVTVPPPGVWIAVCEINADGTFGNILGAARFAGPRLDVEVQLLRSTEPNNTYAVQLYRDDNDGVFDPARNSVYVDFDTGARVVSYFTTEQ